MRFAERETREKHVRKHAIFDRLEMHFVMIAEELRAFLIAELSIRKCGFGE